MGLFWGLLCRSTAQPCPLSLTCWAPGVTLENETSQSQGRAVTAVRELDAQRQVQVVRVIEKEDNEERWRERWGKGNKSNC